MLLFGVYHGKDNDAAEMPTSIETPGSFRPGMLCRAFVLASSPEEQKRAEDDMDLRRLNQLLEAPTLRNAWSIASLTQTLESRYGGEAPKNGVVYAVTGGDETSFTTLKNKVGGIAANRATAKAMGGKVFPYKIGG